MPVHRWRILRGSRGGKGKGAKKKKKERCVGAVRVTELEGRIEYEPEWRH